MVRICVARLATSGNWFTSTLSASSSPFKHFHYVQQVCLLFGKQSTKSVYLFRAYIFTAVSFKRVQQTVGLKSVVTIVQIVRFVPIYHTLTQCGEPP